MKVAPLLLVMAALAFSSPLQARGSKAYKASPAASAASAAVPPTAPDEATLIEHGHYVNKSGAVVHSPAHTATGAPPAGASAQCRDGSYSFSRSHRGTCSHHGGVAHWL